MIDQKLILDTLKNKFALEIKKGPQLPSLGPCHTPLRSDQGEGTLEDPPHP